MPEETTTQTPPATQQIPPAQTPNVGSAFPKPSGELHFGQETFNPSNDPKPGSARDKMRQNLRSKAKPSEDAAPATPPPATPPPSTDDQQPDPGSTDQPGTDTPGNQPPKPVDQPEKGRKPNPWKMVDEWKGKYADLEKQIAELKKPDAQLTEQERSKYLEQIKQLESRKDELEKEIRFVDYSKSEEFKQKFEKPYLDSWHRAARELRDIPVMTEDGTERMATPQDLGLIVNARNIVEAKQIAQQMFGDFADDAMSLRKDILSHWNNQQEALQEAREKGLEREKMTAEQRQKQERELGKFLQEEFKKASQEVFQDEHLSRYFKAAEGDEEGKKLLEKGFAQADEVFQANAMDPSLTPEERAAIVRKHVAMRNKTASWGFLRHQNDLKDAQIKELKARLAEYEQSEPPGGAGSSGAPPPAGPSSARDQVHGALRKIARAG